MITKLGSANLTGPNASGEYIYKAAILTLAAAAVCAQGQVLCIDTTKKVGQSPAETANSGFGDQIVLPTATGAGKVFGVYQGATITNSAAVAQTYEVQVLVKGAGVVLAQAKAAGTAVVVGGILALDSTPTLYPIQNSTFDFQRTLGMATATGAVVTSGATIIAVPGSNQTITLINAYLSIT